MSRQAIISKGSEQVSLRLRIGLEVEAVALLLERIDDDDALQQLIGFLVVLEFRHQLLEFLALLDDQRHHGLHIRAALLDIVHVQAEHDFLDQVDDFIQHMRNVDDVLAVDGRQKLAQKLAHHVMLFQIGGVLDLVDHVRLLAQVLGLEVAEHVVQRRRSLASAVDHLAKEREIAVTGLLLLFLFLLVAQNVQLL